MLKSTSLVSLSLTLTLGFVIPACSSSSGSSADDAAGGAGATAGSASRAGGAAGASDRGGSTNLGGAGDGGSAGARSTGSNGGTIGSSGSTGLPAGPAACAYSISGALSDPSTDAPYGCGNGHIEQANGSGDFTASIGAGFMDAAGNVVALACTISSATAPAAGDVWKLSKDAHANGNCQFNSSNGATSTSWSASSTDSTISGSAMITFTSATLIKSTYHPMDVYYVYDVAITATLPALTPDTADVTISGTFKNTVLPLGS